MQWHPHFAKLLRPLLEGYFDVQINVPVGDVPREADLVLVRRTASGKLPFHGLWKYLTTWNVLEYKGPTVSARAADVDLLLELGLGIQRRLREKSTIASAPAASEVSFWYLAHRLGRRFLTHVEQSLGPLELLGSGIWRCKVVGRLLFLISGEDLPVEVDSLPFHILEPGSANTEQAIARVLIGQPTLLPTLGDWALNLHPALFREIAKMARTKQLNPKIKPLVDFLGIDEVVRQLSQEEGFQKLMQRYFASMTPKERKALRKQLLEDGDAADQ